MSEQKEVRETVVEDDESYKNKESPPISKKLSFDDFAS